MITGTLKSQVDKIWDTFWSGGISNPISVIEQFTYLLFMRQLDERQASNDFQRTLGVDPSTADIFDKEHQHLRWRNLMEISDGAKRRKIIVDEVFPFLRTLGGSGFAQHMSNASFGIENPATLISVMKQVNDLKFANKDIAGDLYEYMLSKLTTSGTNGQFRTPSHIIDLMVELMRPSPTQRVIDPASGTAGFLVAASEWTRRHHAEELLDARLRQRYNESGLTGFDFDSTMVRIAAMNMFMHGFEDPNISYRDALQQVPHEDQEAYDIVLANPPFAGSIDESSMDPALSNLVSSKKTELLFVARFLTLLKPGGRAAVIVPEGVLFGSTKAHKQLRKHLLDEQRLDAVIKLPSGAFKPYSGVSTAILCFTRTDRGSTEDVWFYEVTADGFSLDDKRTPLLAAHLLGPTPTVRPRDSELADDNPDAASLTADQHELNNLPDVLTRWQEHTGAERKRARTEQSFTVPAEEIREADYDLSMNRYKEIVFGAEDTRDPLEIIAEIKELDAEIAAGMGKLEAMLQEGK
ncbi:class I SAM-dependent DNA methyltransferase [Corynebacterium glutamicum]|uniref:class I SAM-dependent DNA methyltransferase n=1 Tax=Corynebacterium TaxID=1716 RepID=UPI00019623F3|nr:MULTISPECIES: class I SAM-dependent DNA methyltransferase [Corynebacterium]ALP48815.1 DNA methyltransferase [Corynebacterium glutamicum]ANR61072.1 type I restriction-modification system, methyltransferase subunit [[Brevibacterium] flavum ZL-1]ANR64072.1 type I restriction-modification system, methyltransferase subunit [Corynebacterium glutamicum ZL-6]ANU32347.1 DNA methyltransferase [Corynebacterium glutamicum]APT06092.1 DNA methyltransferase [Corynebacterium glutamicum]